MKIGLDAMGGDLAPAATVEGALLALREKGTPVTLIGIEQSIRAELQRLGHDGHGIDIVHAASVVGMDEQPMAAVRSKRDSSLAIGMGLLKRGEIDAFVSAGNSGAVMATALFTLGRIPGVDRPAISTIVPCPTGKFLLLDMGANTDCKPQYLLQFAAMGSKYVEKAFGISRPTVALLSIGEEPSKGNAATREAFQLLSKTSLNFIGNIEGKDLPRGAADVVVTDGFVGNICIKLGEGIYETVFTMLREEMTRDLKSKIAAKMLMPAFRRLKRRMDYAEYGGAPLLGVDGTCIVAHGRSSAKAIGSAIRMAREACEQGVTDAMREGIQNIVAPASQSLALHTEAPGEERDR